MSKKKEALKHAVRFEAGHDCIRFECKWGSQDCEPNKGGSHGIGGLRVRFLSKGKAGAVQFLLYTGWEPRYCEPSAIGSRDLDLNDKDRSYVMPADLGYHSKTPQYEEQSVAEDACEFVDGQPCYYDGSGLKANDAMYALLNGGEDALWQFLDAFYACVFEGGEYPTPAEYAMKPRKSKGGSAGRLHPLRRSQAERRKEEHR